MKHRTEHGRLSPRRFLDVLHGPKVHDTLKVLGAFAVLAAVGTTVYEEQTGEFDRVHHYLVRTFPDSPDWIIGDKDPMDLIGQDEN